MSSDEKGDSNTSLRTKSTDAFGIWGWLPVLICGAGMLAITWRTWPHLYVDFGRELYVAWRLAEGEALYRDIAYFNGPLSPYFNALIFRIFGASLAVLLIGNGLILASLTVLLHSILRRVSSHLVASLACSFFLVVFAFSQLSYLGNDNYLSPYSHEMTHGLTLAVLAIWLWGNPRISWRNRVAACGLVLGFVFLTKVEVFLAALLAVGTGIALDARRRERVEVFCGLGRAIGAAAIPIFLSIAFLCFETSLQESVRGTLGSWVYVFERELTSQYFYRATMGTLELRENLLSIGTWVLGVAGYFVLVGGLSWVVSRQAGEGEHESRSAWGRVFLVLIPASLAGLVLSQFEINWIHVPHLFPILLPIWIGIELFQLRSRVTGTGPPGAAHLRIVLLVFSTGLLAKVFFQASFKQYGFVLTMPGTLMLVILLLDIWPRSLAKATGALLVRSFNFGLVGFVALWIASQSMQYVELRQVPVGIGADELLSTEHAQLVNELLAVIEKDVAPDETLAVLPEGVMINYLARRRNPTTHINFMPPEFIIFGEDTILQAFREHPPDWIVLISRDFEEYGLEGFGIDYGRELFDWVRVHYQPQLDFGVPPARWRSHEFGLRLLRRSDAR